jgi:hypothetical protein
MDITADKECQTDYLVFDSHQPPKAITVESKAYTPNGPSFIERRNMCKVISIYTYVDGSCEYNILGADGKLIQTSKDIEEKINRLNSHINNESIQSLHAQLQHTVDIFKKIHKKIKSVARLSCNIKP